MVKVGLMTKEERNNYLTAENKAYDNLIRKGYSPQGCDKNFEKVIVFKIFNPHTNDEKKDIYYFKDWQEADADLV